MDQARSRRTRTAASRPASSAIAPVTSKWSRQRRSRASTIKSAGWSSYSTTTTRSGSRPIIDRDAYRPAIDRYQKMHEAGALTVRLGISHHVDTLGPLDKILEEIRRVAAHPLRHGGPRLRIVGIKTYLDGGMLTGSAYMREPWGVSKIYAIDDPSYRGVLFIPHDRLVPIVNEAVASDLQFTAHSVGDGAVQALLDAYEEVNQHTRIAPTRPCITHSNFMSREAIEQAARLSVVVDIQPAWFIWTHARSPLNSAMTASAISSHSRAFSRPVSSPAAVRTTCKKSVHSVRSTPTIPFWRWKSPSLGGRKATIERFTPRRHFPASRRSVFIRSTMPVSCFSKTKSVRSSLENRQTSW